MGAAVKCSDSACSIDCTGRNHNTEGHESMNSRNISALRGAPLIVLAALIAGCTLPGIQTAPKVPEALRVPANQRLALEADATGVQIYDCKPVKDNPAHFEWA